VNQSWTPLVALMATTPPIREELARKRVSLPVTDGGPTGVFMPTLLPVHSWAPVLALKADQEL